MKRSKFTEEQAALYIWKKKYGDLGASEVRHLRQLEEENLRLKWLVADLTLDKNFTGGN